MKNILRDLMKLLDDNIACDSASFYIHAVEGQPTFVDIEVGPFMYRYLHKYVNGVPEINLLSKINL